MVALELRETEVTRAADVVFPVAPVTDKAGTFVNWEGRPRPFEAVLGNPASLPDLRVLAGIAEELAELGQGSPLGFRTVAEARAAMEEMGPWDGDARRAMSGCRAGATTSRFLNRRGRRARHLEADDRQRLDAGRRQATSPPPRARRSRGSAPRCTTRSARPSPSPVTAAR